MIVTIVCNYNNQHSGNSWCKPRTRCLRTSNWRPWRTSSSRSGSTISTFCRPWSSRMQPIRKLRKTMCIRIKPMRKLTWSQPPLLSSSTTSSSPILTSRTKFYSRTKDTPPFCNCWRRYRSCRSSTRSFHCTWWRLYPTPGLKMNRMALFEVSNFQLDQILEMLYTNIINNWSIAYFTGVNPHHGSIGRLFTIFE